MAGVGCGDAAFGVMTGDGVFCGMIAPGVAGVADLALALFGGCAVAVDGCDDDRGNGLAVLAG